MLHNPSPPNQMTKTKNYPLLLSTVLLLLVFSQCQTVKGLFDDQGSGQELETMLIQEAAVPIEKQKGAHVFGIGDATDFEPLEQDNIEWITLVGWGVQDDHNSQLMTHGNGDSLRMRRRDSSLLCRIELVHEAGFKVFVKPHIWVRAPSDGKWRSDIYPTSDDNWALWQESYRTFILRYAKIAEAGDAEMFCVGTELSRLSVEKPAYWEGLIQEIRTVYSGKLTYAANWYNEYEKITFWDRLDVIGVQAYFPLVENECPSVEQISAGWMRHLTELEAVHKRYNRNILFTEMGYKSTSASAIKPWEWIENSAEEENVASVETQANCYKAFFNTVWDKEWFAGVHLWQYRADVGKGRGRGRRQGRKHLDFTPQGKLAEEVIANGFE